MIPSCSQLDAILGDFADILTLGQAAKAEDERLLTPQLELSAKRMAHRLARAAERAVQSNLLQELDEILGAPSAGAQGTSLFVAWVELIEEFAREAERRYGPKAGPLKLRFVEAGVLSFLQRIGGRLPWSSPFAPFVFKIVVDFVVESVLKLVDEANLWRGLAQGATAAPTGGVLARWWAAFVRWLQDLAWRVVLSQYRVPAKLQTAIDAVTTGPYLQALSEALRRGMRLLAWAGKHSKDIFSLIDVVYSAVNEAERLAELPGPTKQAYARAMIVAFLEETGFLRGRSELFMTLVNGFLDGAIDSVVKLLKKRRPDWELTKNMLAQNGA